jgi:hypothetical protein
VPATSVVCAMLNVKTGAVGRVVEVESLLPPQPVSAKHEEAAIAALIETMPSRFIMSPCDRIWPDSRQDPII